MLERTWGSSQCYRLQYNSWPELYSPFQKITCDGLTQCNASRTVPCAPRLHRPWPLTASAVYAGHGTGTEPAVFLQALLSASMQSQQVRMEKSNKGQGCPSARECLLSTVLNHFLSSPLPLIVVVYRSWPHECKRSTRSKAYEGVFDILLLHFKHKTPNCEPNQNTEKTHGNQIISNSRQLLLCKSLSTAVKLSPEAHQPLLSKLLTDLHLPRKRDSGYSSLHHPHSPQGFTARLLAASKREAHELQPALPTSSMAPGSLWGSTKPREDEFQWDVLLSKFSHPEA